MKKLRRFGDVTQSLETVLSEMAWDHDLQHGEILNIVRCWLEIHHPAGREVYVEDDSSPEFYYGPKRK